MLNSKVVVFLPSVANGQAIETQTRENAIDETASLLAKLAGGATAQNAMGYWLSDRDGLVKEDVTLLTAFCQAEKFESMRAALLAHAEYLKNKLQQEAIAVQFNETLELV